MRRLGDSRLTAGYHLCHLLLFSRPGDGRYHRLYGETDLRANNDLPKDMEDLWTGIPEKQKKRVEHWQGKEVLKEPYGF